MSKKRVCFLLVAILLLSYTTVAFADTISDKKKELKNVEEDIENKKSDIDELKSEQDKLIGQIADIEVELNEKKKQLTEVEEILEEIQKNIDETQKELDEAVKKEDAHRKLMDERICAMYMSSDISYLEILLDAKSVTDFLDRLEMVKEIMSLDQEVLEKMQAIKEEVKERKENLEAQEEAEECIKEEIIAQKKAIEDKQEEKEVLLADLKDKQKKIETDLDKLEKTSKDLENEIKRLVAEREERARRERALALATNTNSRGGDRTLIDNTDSGQGDSDSGQDPGSTISGNGGKVIGIATAQLGKPYVYSASGPSAFDCSGFTMYVYGQCGVSLPHSAAGQATCSVGIKITNRSALQPGDLVFFSNSSSSLGHAGIYMGGGQFIHASSSKRKVVIESIDSAYRKKHFRWGRRIFS